jgi:hypothetical protein
MVEAKSYYCLFDFGVYFPTRVSYINLLNQSIKLLPILVECEELLHTFHMKICIHKIHLRVELLCNCILTS